MLDSYRRSMIRVNLAPGTIAKRIAEARAWRDYCDDLTTAGREQVEAWLDGRPLCARSRHAAISHLHMFYRWAIREGHARHDPTVEVERPRLPRRLPRPIPEHGVSVALATAAGEVRTMVALMAWAALRCCEVARLTWADVDLIAGTLHVSGKGSRDRVIPIGRQLRAELAALDGVDGPVIGRTITPGRVSQIVNAHLDRCGLGQHTAHAFRHRKLTRLYEDLRDVLVVREYAGHANASTTEIYVQIAAGRMAAISALDD